MRDNVESEDSKAGQGGMNRWEKTDWIVFLANMET
jgi:hypothetical protein